MYYHIHNLVSDPILIRVGFRFHHHFTVPPLPPAPQLCTPVVEARTFHPPGGASEQEGLHAQVLQRGLVHARANLQPQGVYVAG